MYQQIGMTGTTYNPYNEEHMGVKGAFTKSARELAQSMPFQDYATGKFTLETPNDAFLGLKNFFIPKVLA